MRGHLWTLLPHLRDALGPPPAYGVEWSATVQDSRMGAVRLSGILDELPGARRLVVIVHGMGGHANKGYVRRAAWHARELGMSTLRLNLRGACDDGEDIYHAGLVDDMKAAVASPQLAGYEHLHALGFSLGGHMVARYALDPDARVRSVAALCSPLDLDEACEHIDHLRQYVYRQHLLSGLKKDARHVERMRSIRLAPKSLRRITKIRDWDEQVIAPRFGFAGASDYYKQVSVGPHLSRIDIPTLLVFTRGDPMVGRGAIQSAFNSQNPLITLRQVNGGHVHLPAKTGALRGSLRWLMKASDAGLA